MDTKRTIATDIAFQTRVLRGRGATLLSIAMALGLAACVPARTTSESLERARIAVQSAEVDVSVSLYAVPDLRRAKHELQLADAAAAEHDMNAAIRHAYFATRSAKLAQLYGVTKADEARFAVTRCAVSSFIPPRQRAGYTES